MVPSATYDKDHQPGKQQHVPLFFSRRQMASRAALLLLAALAAALIVTKLARFQLRSSCVLLSAVGVPAIDSRAAAAAPGHFSCAGCTDSFGKEIRAINSTEGYTGATEHPACRFFRTGASGVTRETTWAPYNLCDLDVPGMWLQRVTASCYSCLNPSHNACKNPSRLTYNMYLVALHPKESQANLLSLKAFLMTQDLHRAKMVLWVDDPAAVYTNTTAAFFDKFAEHITIKRFDYQQEVKGTPWERDAFFGNGSAVRSFMPMPGSWSDVVRILLLHKYGDFWMDNDVVLYRDVAHLLDISYQFVMRWMNLHIMRMQPGSPLTLRAMQVAAMMPLNHPQFKQNVMEKLCKPNGYIEAHPKYNGTDIYNTCLFRVLLRVNNTGPPGAVLYDLPLGWWDHDWPHCFDSRKAINDSQWRKVAGSFLAMHNRYPGDINLGDVQPPSPLRRVVKIVDDYFSFCSSASCMPPDGMPLLAYD